MSSNSTPATAKVILMASALPLSGKYESLYFGIALVKIRTKTARGLIIWRGLLSMETEMWWNVMWPSRVNSERQSQLAWLTWLQRNLSSLFRQKWVERGVKVGIWYSKRDSNIVNKPVWTSCDILAQHADYCDFHDDLYTGIICIS